MGKRICSFLLCLLLCMANPAAACAASGSDYTRLGLNDAWKYSTGKGVNVAVIDSGANLNDPVIAPRIKGVYNAFTGSTKREDVHGSWSHGTSCAKALVGAAPGVNLYIIKAGDSEGIYDDAVEKGLRWAKSQKCRVISMSFGGDHVSTYSALISELYYASSNSVLVCASGGNTGKYEYHYPASLDHTLSVAAAQYNAGKKQYVTVTKGTYNNKMDVAAPGGASSSAAAFAAGAAALLFQANPSMTARECHTLLRDTALDLGTKGKDYRSGYGLIQPYKALKKILNMKPAPSPTPSPAPQYAKSLKLSSEKMTISAGKSKRLTCTRIPSSSKDKIEWSSDHPSIASVDSSGNVKGQEAGTAVITARTSRGVKASCKVTVCPAYMNGWLRNSVNGKTLHGQLLVTWNRDAKSSGYQIQIASDAKFTQNVVKKVIWNNKTTELKFTGLGKGRGYYMRMRAYKTVGKTTYYGGWVRTTSPVHVQ